MALVDGLDQVVQLARAPGCDHRHADGVRHRAGQLQFVAVAGAVAVHARQQDLPRPALGRLARPLDRLALDRDAPAVDENIPFRSLAGRRRDQRVATLGVDGDDHALRAEDVGQLVQQLRAPQRR